MKKPSIEQIIKSMEKLNYSIFRDNSKDYNLNIVGIRSDDHTPNIFNDLEVVFWRSSTGWTSYYMKVTTDPGLYWLNNPMNVNGTAILKAGQYKGLWKLGLHQGKYEALVQKAPCTVIRDINRDGKLDFTGKEDTGIFGINNHRANEKVESTKVEKWSAGCIVIANPKDFENHMKICNFAAKNWGNSFTYTLIKEKDLI